MFWLILANALLIPAWAIVPLGVNLLRNARRAPTPGRRGAAIAVGLGILVPAVVCTSAFAWYWLASRMLAAK